MKQPCGRKHSADEGREVIAFGPKLIPNGLNFFICGKTNVARKLKRKPVGPLERTSELF
ncbi:MAG: hypothetical protein ACTS6H_02980 [Candidatus Hodgkinia cicadicola]